MAQTLLWYLNVLDLSAVINMVPVDVMIHPLSYENCWLCCFSPLFAAVKSLLSVSAGVWVSLSLFLHQGKDSKVQLKGTSEKQRETYSLTLICF